MIFVALGSNLPGPFGPPEAALEEAKRELQRRGVAVVQSSRTWLTEPVPVSDQPLYRNAVIAVQTKLKPRALFALLKAIEKDFGRTSSEKNASRVLDLDLIAYNDEIVNEDGLIVPHPRVHERAFVLLPLREIAEGWEHPVLKQPLEKLIERLPPGQKVKAA